MFCVVPPLIGERLRHRRAALAARGRGDLDLGGLPGAVRASVEPLERVVGDRRARGHRAGGRDERRLLLVALAAHDLEGGDDRHRGAGGREHQGARLAARHVTEVDGGGHAGLDVQGLVARGRDQARGRGEAHLQVGVGVAGHEGDQSHGGGVLRDAGQDEAARGVGGGGQPVAAGLVVQGLHGGADPAAADGHVHGEVRSAARRRACTAGPRSLECGWTVMPSPTVDLRVPSLPYSSMSTTAAESSGLVRCT